jgi:hexosaminidase
MTVCWNNGKPYQPIYSVQGEIENLNPINQKLYPFLKDVLGEFANLFVDDYIHLGMDEVYYACW